MVLLESLNLNQDVLDFNFLLPDSSGKQFSYKDIKRGNGMVVIFTCNHCPYAKAIWARLINLANQFMPKGIGFVAINPNSHSDYPEDSPENMARLVKEYSLPFPYLYDETQAVAKAYRAVCTPDIYVLDATIKLFYHGRLDDSWKDDKKVRSFDLFNALDALVAGKSISNQVFPSMGCSIKWQT